MRMKLVQLHLNKYYSNQRITRMIKLRLWIRRQMRRWRKGRGKVHREAVFIRRIQSLVRGILWRKQLKKMHQAQIKIRRLWRKYWGKHYRPYGKKILKAYRKVWLYRKVVNIQCFSRFFDYIYIYIYCSFFTG